MTVSKQIIEVIDALCEKFGIAIDWTANNVIPYIETLCARIVSYEIWMSVFYMVLWVFLAGVMWIISIPLSKKAKEVEWDFDYPIPFCAAVVIVIAVIFSVIALANIGTQSFDIIEANVFPEKTIYDFVSYLIQTNQHN